MGGDWVSAPKIFALKLTFFIHKKVTEVNCKAVFSYCTSNVSIDEYRIVENFQGSKLLRIRPKIIFTELIFANFIIQPFCTVSFIILRISKNHEKGESYWPGKFLAIQYCIVGSFGGVKFWQINNF